MNDFDYDVMTKKRLARQSRGTIKSKRTVTLPHDGITRKEWEKMNGEVKVFYSDRAITKEEVNGAATPRRVMDWKAFKEMSDDQQREYLRQLQECFDVDMKRISIALGVSAMTLSKRCSAIGYEVRPFKPTKFDADLWYKFVNDECPMPKEAQAADETPQDDAEPMCVTNDIPDIESALKAIMDALKGTGAKITIEVTL